MTWYTASIILTIKVREGGQEYFPVFENFVLIKAESDEDAYKKAEEIGKESIIGDEDVSFKGKKADYRFLGIRKVRSVYNPDPLDIDRDRPTHETELSHSYYEVDTIESAELLAQGNIVNIRYVDDCG